MMQSAILKLEDIQTRIIHIIEESEQFCYIVTPWFDPWDSLVKSLVKAEREKKNITFILRDEIESHEWRRLKTRHGFRLFFVERLHTKLYMNEKEALITSMNCCDSSKEFNYELGYDITNLDEIQFLKTSIVEQDILNGLDCYEFIDNTSTYKDDPFIGKKGFCIRCKKSIAFNPKFPFCEACFSSWIKFRNHFYKEKCCHRCGKDYQVNLAKPLCISCFKTVMAQVENMKSVGKL
ncbi:MAG: hypothetical protein IJ717_03070 [Treponema sp.]|nr:hypothetical protein [Treponema sp.]